MTNKWYIAPSQNRKNRAPLFTSKECAEKLGISVKSFSSYMQSHPLKPRLHTAGLATGKISHYAWEDVLEWWKEIKHE